MKKKEIIDRYLAEELTQEEQVTLDKWMEEDASFAEEIKFHDDLKVAAVEYEKAVLKTQLEKKEHAIVNKGKRNLRRILLIVLGIMLLLAAFLGYRYEKMKKSPEGIYASNYETFPNLYHPVTRGSGDLMTEAFTAYENGNFSLAADKIEEQLKTSSALELKFYQAMAYGEMGNLPLAIGRLEDIRRFQSDYLDESYWYLGLYYIKQGNYTFAIDRLQTFIELSKDEKKIAAATKILKLII